VSDPVRSRHSAERAASTSWPSRSRTSTDPSLENTWFTRAITRWLGDVPLYLTRAMGGDSARRWGDSLCRWTAAAQTSNPQRASAPRQHGCNTNTKQMPGCMHACMHAAACGADAHATGTSQQPHTATMAPCAPRQEHITDMGELGVSRHHMHRSPVIRVRTHARSKSHSNNGASNYEGQAHYKDAASAGRTRHAHTTPVPHVPAALANQRPPDAFLDMHPKPAATAKRQVIDL